MAEQTGRIGKTAPSGSSRIHDIGYRHYDGARLGRGYIRRSLIQQSLRGAYGLGRSGRSKALPMILFGVMVLPAAIIVAVAVQTKMDHLPVDYRRYAVLLQAVIGLFLASQAPQAVSLDLRYKTIPLYFSRPLSTRDYVLSKFAALSGALFVLTATPVLVLYVGALLGKLDFADQTKGFLAGLVSVALLSLLFAGIGLVVAAANPPRGFGVAAVIALLTIPYGAVSTLQGIAYNAGNDGAVSWFGLFSPITLIDGLQSAWLGAESAFPAGAAPSAGQGAVYAVVVVGLIVASHLLLERRYRKAGL